MESTTLTITRTSSANGEFTLSPEPSGLSNPVSWSFGDGRHLLTKYPAWDEKEYRDAFVEACTEEGVTFQIRVNREARGWSQRELAERVGTQQSAIARLEDPARANIRLSTLQKLAHAFDCALLVKFVPFSALADDLEQQRVGDLVARAFEDECGIGTQR